MGSRLEGRRARMVKLEKLANHGRWHGRKDTWGRLQKIPQTLMTLLEGN